MSVFRLIAAGLVAGCCAASAVAQNPTEEAFLDGVEIIVEQCMLDLEAQKPLEVVAETCTTALSRLDSYASLNAADTAFASSLSHIEFHHAYIELALALRYVDVDLVASPRVCGALERAVAAAGRIDYATALPELAPDYRVIAEEADGARTICQ
jgi:hypothetical protein